MRNKEKLTSDELDHLRGILRCPSARVAYSEDFYYLFVLICCFIYGNYTQNLFLINGGVLVFIILTLRIIYYRVKNYKKFRMAINVLLHESQFMKDDLNELEKYFQIKLPESYKGFLMELPIRLSQSLPIEVNPDAIKDLNNDFVGSYIHDKSFERKNFAIGMTDKNECYFIDLVEESVNLMHGPLNQTTKINDSIDDWLMELKNHWGKRSEQED